MPSSSSSLPFTSVAKIDLQRNVVAATAAAAGSNRDPEAAAGAAATAATANGASAATAPPSQQHLGQHRQYWRDIILGVNDGLVSTFLLVAGVCGGGLTSVDILLTAIAGALAGAISMCAGEYVATKSQNEVLEGELSLETMHINYRPQDEVNELHGLFSLIGINEDMTELQESLVHFYESHPAALLKIMTALEFGVLSRERRSPVAAGLTSCALFTVGSLPSVLPFAFSGDRPVKGLIAAAVTTIVCLLTVGAVKTWATRGNCMRSSLENLVIATMGGGLAYGVGVLFASVLH
jgi:vacuolar iron transporter family protein